MPELPDIDVYVRRIEERVGGSQLESVRISNPFLLRTFEPPLETLHGKTLLGLSRLGKRIVFEFEADFFLVLHLMVAGRLHWRESARPLKSKSDLADFQFSSGVLLLTEAGSKKRASLHAVRGNDALAAHDPGGIEPLTCSADEFKNALTVKNRTLKRALTDPRILSGIGNAYSDEILHAARLSPIRHTTKLKDEETERLYRCTQSVLEMWRERLMQDSSDRFPEKVTAFRPEMAVHGRFGKPCPDCDAPVQRIRYKSRETNYCAACQTDGKVLADRSLSRLLKDDWPDSL